MTRTVPMETSQMRRRKICRAGRKRDMGVDSTGWMKGLKEVVRTSVPGGTAGSRHAAITLRRVWGVVAHDARFWGREEEKTVIFSWALAAEAAEVVGASRRCGRGRPGDRRRCRG